MSARLHTLSNGLRVLCDPMPGLRTLALAVTVRGGARWEDEARSGWSHLLEHMVFKGAGDMSARQIVERIEAQGGSINASTSYERTSFQVRALEGGLPLAMAVVSDLVFRPHMAPAELEREKQVVGQEIAEAFDTPDDHVFEMAQTRAFAGQPLGRPVLGDVDSVDRAQADSLDAWRRALYAPERMAVSVAGAVDEAELLALAERWFGEPGAGAGDEPAPARFTGGHAALSRRIEQANLVLQLPAPSAADPDYPALRLFVEILGGGMASRLFQEAREGRGLAYAIDGYSESYDDAGVLGVYAGCAADKAAELAELAAKVIVQMSDGVGDDELARAKAQLKGSLFMAQESPSARAERNAHYAFLRGRPVSAEESAAELEAVDAERLRGLAARLLAPGLAATAVLGPRAALKAGEAFGRGLFG